jgi:AAA+ ATPase superfamily predicted ATPase
MFIGRHTELAALRSEFSAARASLAIVYGRRRIGKSTLIREAAHGRPHVFYQATRVTSSLNLEAFKAEIARTLEADGLLEGIADWTGVLHYLARVAERRRGLIILLDEFPYLVDTDPALPSIIQKFWDSGAAASGHLKLLLCGSLIAQMEELLRERNPLYGRKTLALDLGPLPLREAARFVPRYTAEDKLVTYAIFGGMPFYLQMLDPNASLRTNVVRLLLTPTSQLADEPAAILQSELREVSRYASVLAAIADGCTKPVDIVGRVKEIGDSKTLWPYLDKLARMRLVCAVSSMGAGPRDRDRRYFLADPLLAFWHRFVRPNLSSVAQGFGEQVWKLQIDPHVDHFMGTAFEDLCRDHAQQHSQERLPAPAQEIGRIWEADYDIDVAGKLLDGSMLYGECKWWKDQVGENVLNVLIERSSAAIYGQGKDKRQFVLYSKKGFTSALRKRAAATPNLILHTPRTMLHERRHHRSASSP